MQTDEQEIRQRVTKQNGKWVMARDANLLSPVSKQPNHKRIDA